ncbi:hypothetical protein ACFL27_13030, partial [candidate division CSSED10-310 bacterium]
SSPFPRIIECRPALSVEYDIRGTWTIEFKWNSMSQARIIWQEFTGNKDYGTWTNEDFGSGAWKVTDDTVEWTYYESGDAVYTGQISDDQTMSGTMSASSDTGTWSAVR